MPGRYLILSGRCRDLRARLMHGLPRHDLGIVLELDDLLILSSPDLPIVMLDGGRGVIIGELFSREPPFETAHTLPRAAQRAIVDGVRGDALIRDFWGHYVAALVESDGRNLTILRAPFGSLGAYHVSAEDGIAITPDVGLLGDLGLMPGGVDWDSVARHVIAPNLRMHRTCLLVVAELMGGYGLSITSGKFTLFEAWNPWRFTDRRDNLTDDVEAVELLRRCVDGCVGALARTTNHAVLGVSGGLDSSIVAAALAQSGAKLSCLTLFTRDAAGDERRFARILAGHLGVQLFEMFEDVAHVDVTRSDAAHLPRPIARGFAQSGDRSNLAVARNVGADTFFSGGGGDNVFCYLQSAAPVADCLMTGRLRQLWPTARDISQIADCSIWTALRSGVRRACFGSRTYRWRPELAFLTAQMAAEGPSACISLWADAPQDALPGKATHVAWLIGILNHLEGYGRERSHRTVWPLMALPIIELCLRIPSWMWSRGGQNRALARRAYANALPSDILERRSKGTPDSVVVELFEANRERIRQLLCDGLLAANGIVNRDEIASFLVDKGPVRGLGYWRIMALTDVEAWLQTVGSNRNTA